MAEYISREAVLKCIEKDGYEGEYDLGYYPHNSEFQELIKEIHAADVVEMVRCKDCGWWNEDDSAGWGDLGNNVCACAYFSNEDGYTVYTEPNDYCSKGERKEDE